MLDAVRCKTCGFPLGDVSDAIRSLSERLARERLRSAGVAEGQSLAAAAVDTSVGDVLDAFGLSRVCCRTVALTECRFRSYY